ncbi:MAG: 6-phosphogluconolactonase, partial [Candidatus Acidiferrum sp.]
MSLVKSLAEVHILPDGPAIANRCAQKFVEIAAAAVKDNGSFDVVLAGGSTPKTLYGLLVNDAALRARIPWDKMHVFFGDERHVGPSDPQSNFRMANESLISKSPLKPEQVLRMMGEY